MTEGNMDRANQAPERAGQEWLDTLRSLAEQIQKQQQTSQQMTQELMNTYMQLLNTPGPYLSGQAEQQQQTLQQTAQQWMEQAQQQQQTFQQQAQQQQQSFQQMTHRGLRRTYRGRGLRAPWGTLGRRAQGGSRLRGAHQEPRDDPRAVRSQDKEWV
jgi:hypothetical protein